MADSLPMRVRSRAWFRRLLVALAWALLMVLLLLAAWLGAIASLAFAGQAAVPGAQLVAAADVERALSLLKRHDPRWQRPGVIRAVALDERDVNLLLQHAATRLPGLRAGVLLLPQTVDVTLSLDMTRMAPRLGLSWPTRMRPWLNIQASLRATRSLPELERLRMGPVPVPPLLAQWLAGAVLQRLGLGLDPPLLRDVLRRVELREGRLLAFYAWRDDTSKRLLNVLTPESEQERLRVYALRLAEWTHQQGVAMDQPPTTAAELGATTPAAVPQQRPHRSMTQLLQPLFEVARQRVAAGFDATSESRAALVTAMLYANRRHISAVVPAARSWPQPRWFTITLAGRTDTPLHYLISAALAAESGTPLADAVGLYKELADSRGGSGFSFNDLAADRAGTRMGDLATRDAPRLIKALAKGAAEQDVLPDISDLPESLSSDAFEARYGGVGAPAYAKMTAEIETRLDRVPLLR